MINKILLIFFLMFICLTSTFGYKVLMVDPALGRSHHILSKAVVNILLDRGHEVTYITSYPGEISRCREIGLPELAEASYKYKEKSFNLKETSNIASEQKLNEFIALGAEYMLINPNLQKILKNKNETFDAVVLLYLFDNHLLGFGVHFKCPTVMLIPNSFMLEHPLASNIILDVHTAMKIDGSLWQRVKYLLHILTEEFFGIYYSEPAYEEYYKRYFPEEYNIVPYNNLKYEIASVLMNSHSSIDTIKPFLPNTVEIGGYHVEDPKPLPEDIKQILDSAKHGVVFFSMGTNLKSSDMNDNIKSILFDVFSSIQETVLWKFEQDIPNKPKNVFIRKWLPQTGILSHPNVKLFITHGGLLSSTEATHFGKPMLMIPIFGDQHHNAEKFTERGQGLYLHYSNLTHESFAWTLQEVLINKSYTETARRYQNLFNDRPIKARDLVAFQIEHVIRTKGSVHLSPPKLPRYSQLLLDVTLIICVPILISIILLFYFIKTCMEKLYVLLNNKKKIVKPKNN